MPDANLFLEKRIYPRVSAKIPIKYRLVDDLAGINSILERKKNDKDSKTQDLSLGGMYIVANQKLEVGAFLRLEIYLPDKPDPLTASAELVWVNDTGGGIHFLAMKDVDVETLRIYLAKISSE
jgi:c-di-GMP-binding flagellar brake protein YcgR